MHWLIFPCPGKTPRWWCTAIVLPHGGHSSIPQSATGPRGCVRVNSYPLLLISAHREYSGSDGGPFPSMPWDAPELPRRVHVLAAPCRRHPRHGTGRSGESHLPRSVQKVLARHLVVGCPRATKACSRARGILPSPAETRDREVRAVRAHRAGTACLCAHGTLPSASKTKDREVRRKPFAEVRTESISARHLVVGCPRATNACLCAQGTLPLPSETRDREVRRKPGAEVRTESISARHLVVGCARATKACSHAHGTLPSQSETRESSPSWYGVSLCSRHRAVTIRDKGQGGPEKARCRGPDESIRAR